MHCIGYTSTLLRMYALCDVSYEHEHTSESLSSIQRYSRYNTYISRKDKKRVSSDSQEGRVGAGELEGKCTTDVLRILRVLVGVRTSEKLICSIIFLE